MKKKWNVDLETEIQVMKKLNKMFQLGRELDYDTIGMKCYFDEMYQTQSQSNKSVYPLIGGFYLGDWEGDYINYTQYEVDKFVQWVINYNK